MDRVDKATRSKIMSKVGQKHTRPEMKLRQSLHRIGLRYRLHDKKLPGTPDIVFPRYKAALFVHGCFWHRHGCKATTTPTSNTDFWLKKFNANVNRDRRNTAALLNKGWRVAVVWECVLTGNKTELDIIAHIVWDRIRSDVTFTTIPDETTFTIGPSNHV